MGHGSGGDARRVVAEILRASCMRGTRAKIKREVGRLRARVCVCLALGDLLRDSAGHGSHFPISHPRHSVGDHHLAGDAPLAECEGAWVGGANESQCVVVPVARCDGLRFSAAVRSSPRGAAVYRRRTRRSVRATEVARTYSRGRERSAQPRAALELTRAKNARCS